MKTLNRSIVAISMVLVSPALWASDSMLQYVKVKQATAMQLQNAYVSGNKVVSLGRGYTVWGHEVPALVKKGTTVVCAGLVGPSPIASGNVLNVEAVIRNGQTNQVIALARQIYSADALNNPLGQHVLPVQYDSTADAYLKVECRIEGLVAGIEIKSMTAIVGDSGFEVNVSNSHATTLSHSFGKTGVIQVVAMHADGSPVHTRLWRRTAGINYNHVYFDGETIVKVDGWQALETKVRADAEDDIPAIILDKAVLNTNWTLIFDSAKKVMSAASKAWEYIQYIGAAI